MKYYILRLKNCLRIKELCADRSLMCRSKNYLRIEKLFADWRIICRPKSYLHWFIIDWLIYYLHWLVYYYHCVKSVQIRSYFCSVFSCIPVFQELSGNQRTICRSKKYVWSKKYSICKSKNCLQIKEVFHMQLEEPLQNKQLSSANWRSADRRSIWYADWISTDWRTICRSNYQISIYL